MVYDYKLDDAGISNIEEDEDEDIVEVIFWQNWMDSSTEFTMVPDTSYCDIIVPTMNTVQMAYLLEMLLTNHKPVLCIGPTGTGKTLTIADKLLKNLPLEYISHFLMFSARTSANQTQDLIDSKLDKRRKGVFGPPLGRYFIFFIDDLNMPALETYGAQPPIELLRQWMDHKGWYDRKQIAGKLGEICYREPVPGCPQITDLNEPLVDATIYVYSTITSQLLPTPAKSHYTFNLRDLSKVFQGMLMADPAKIVDKLPLLRLWYHESCRVFRDRLVNDEDRNWFDDLMKDMMLKWKTSFYEVVPFDPLLYGDFMMPGSDVKLYELIDNKEKLIQVIEDYMEEYNQINTTKMKLVLFMDALAHICRITRILRQALGNALLLGVGGSGRQSLTKLASHIADYECFQIELSKNYGPTEWREDIKKIMLKAGLQSLSITFLFTDTQIKSESFLEDINNLLNSGDIPNLYALDEQDQIMTAMKPIVQDQGLQPTKANLMAAYTGRVRSNIHTVLCMSPIGEVFRARLRQFPSLVTCCTIDWFNEWPAEALESVAASFFKDISDAEFTPELLRTADDVAKMQEELELARPLLAEAAKDTLVTMEQIQVDTAVAEETRNAVQAEEMKAKVKAQTAQAIADDAQKDLAEALPALDAALASLRNLNKNDVTEVIYGNGDILSNQFPEKGLQLNRHECVLQRGDGKKMKFYPANNARMLLLGAFRSVKAEFT
ncbi:hypothetical protein Chor_011159 [Crotalus horridus]